MRQRRGQGELGTLERWRWRGGQGMVGGRGYEAGGCGGRKGGDEQGGWVSGRQGIEEGRGGGAVCQRSGERHGLRGRLKGEARAGGGRIRVGLEGEQDGGWWRSSRAARSASGGGGFSAVEQREERQKEMAVGGLGEAEGGKLGLAGGELSGGGGGRGRDSGAEQVVGSGLSGWTGKGEVGSWSFKGEGREVGCCEGWWG